MFKPISGFSGFSVDDVAKAKKFYSEVLELKVDDNGMGLAVLLPGGGVAFAYPKKDHQPATFTILNFKVDDIEEAVTDLKGRGVHFERYDGMHQDEKDIARGRAAKMGPDIAWFKDPAGNILSVLQE
jgi:catechol 2,3-dioxygenase-like lactoylglutathione lyase family enzyme